MSHFRDQLLSELMKQGYIYEDVNEIFEQKVLEPIEVATILKWLPKIYSEHYGTADILVRSLMSAREAFDPTLLVDLFENSSLNHYLKSAIALTLSCARTMDISIWIKDQLQNQEYAVERHGLLEGLYFKGDFKDEREYMDFLKSIFDKYHNNTVLKIFKKYGNKDDFKFLEHAAQTADPILAREILKVIRNKRIE